MQKKIIQTYNELAVLRELLENAEQHRHPIAANLRDRMATVKWQIRMYEWAAFNATA